MIGALVLAGLVVIVPHGDDELTVMPEILAATDVTVVVMTDGAATSRCDGSYDCETKRRSSTESFLAEAAPHAKLIWLGIPDGTLTAARVQLTASNICMGCDVLAAGFDYGHPDHDAVRTGVEAVGGWAYDGSSRNRDKAFNSMLKHYGWLVSPTQYEHLGYR